MATLPCEACSSCLPGITVPELQNAIGRAYAGVLHVRRFRRAHRLHKPYFIVAGEVNHQGRFELRSDEYRHEAVAIGRTTPRLNTRRRCFDWVSDGCRSASDMLGLKTRALEKMSPQDGDLLFRAKT
jgi:hypothetical protein